MKVLVTGVAGFIGSNLALRLLSNNPKLKDGHQYNVVGVDNLSYGIRENVPEEVEFFEVDIRDKSIHELFEGVDIVFHLAAKNCINDCQIDPVETAEINVVGTVNIFEASRKARVRKVVYAESSAMYEKSLIFPTPESELHAESFYAVSKLSSMYFAKAYKKYYNLIFTALRYFCVYGPVQDYRRTIPPVMSAFIISLLKGKKPFIYGTGKKQRDFIYVDDVNDFHMKCIHDPRTDHKTFNLGSGTTYSVLDIYQLVTELLGKKIDPIFKADLPGEADRTLADISEAQKLGWMPKTDIKTGLLQAIDYIKNELAKGRI